MRSLSHASHFPFLPQKFPVDWHCSFLQPDCWACSNLPLPCTPATGSALGPSFEGEEKNKQRLVLPFCKASCIKWRGQFLSLRVLDPVRSHCCWLWLPWQVTEGWGTEWRMGGDGIFLYSVYSQYPFQIWGPNLRASPGVVSVCAQCPLPVCGIQARVSQKEKKWQTHRWVGGISNLGLLHSAWYCLLFRVLGELFLALCPVAFNERYGDSCFLPSYPGLDFFTPFFKQSSIIKMLLLGQCDLN